MKENISSPDVFFTRTRIAFMWTRILNTPFWALFSMLPFILYKEFHATPLQITIFVTLKPLTSIFSSYWSASINKRRDRLLSNVVWACLLGYFPFFFFPFINSAWFVIVSSAIYMMLAQRGVVPAWMEILKLNIPEHSRERVFAYTSAFVYLGDAIFSFALGWLLDGYFQAWRWIFPLTALTSLFAIILQVRIPIRFNEVTNDVSKISPSFFQQVIQPWVSAWEILRKRKDFIRFQIGFMLGGAGLMVMQPALPGFFVDVLNLSYIELAVAITFCKGIGFVCTSSLWAKWIKQVDIFWFCSCVTMLACLFTFGLLGSQFNLVWLYVAYIGYGIMQAGSELGWHMSGPHFAKEEDSSAYSSINLLTGGLRGCVAPPLGGLLCVWADSWVVILLGGGLCFLATLQMVYSSRKHHQAEHEALVGSA